MNKGDEEGSRPYSSSNLNDNISITYIFYKTTWIEIITKLYF